MEEYFQISPLCYRLPAITDNGGTKLDTGISRKEALDVVQSRDLSQYTDRQLLYRIAIYTDPYLLEQLPLGEDPQQELDRSHQRYRPWLEAYNVLLSILPRVDFKTVDEKQEGVDFLVANSRSVFEQLAGTSHSGRVRMVRDNSTIRSRLMHIYPSLSPKSTNPNLRSPKPFDAKEKEFSFSTLPPRVDFAEYLAANLLVQHCYRSVLDLMNLFANIDKNWINLLLHAEMLFCLCRLRYPPIPNLETRAERYFRLSKCEGKYTFSAQGESTESNIFFSVLLSNLYPTNNNEMFLETEARNFAPLAYFACFTPTALEERVKKRLKNSRFALTFAIHILGMRVPKSESPYDYFVTNVYRYRGVAWRLENELYNPSFTETERNLRGIVEVGAYRVRTDYELLDKVGLVYYSSRRELVHKAEEIDSGRGRNFYLLPREKSDQCSNNEDPVSFEDLDLDYVLVIGNVTKNTCVNIGTLFDLMRQENLRTYRGLFDPSTEDVFSYKSALEIGVLLGEYVLRRSDQYRKNIIGAMKNFYERLGTVEDTFKQLSEENQNKVHSILMSLFRAGMYMRGWNGGTEAYPLEARQTFCEITPDKEVEYSRELTTARILLESSEQVRSLADSMNVYTIESQGVLEKKNNSLFGFVLTIRQDTCMRMLSNELLATSSYYLNKVLNEVPQGFDRDRLDKVVLSPQEIRQTRQHGGTSREILAFEEVQERRQATARRSQTGSGGNDDIPSPGSDELPEFEDIIPEDIRPPEQEFDRENFAESRQRHNRRTSALTVEDVPDTGAPDYGTSIVRQIDDVSPRTSVPQEEIDDGIPDIRSRDNRTSTVRQIDDEMIPDIRSPEEEDDDIPQTTSHDSDDIPDVIPNTDSTPIPYDPPE